MWEALALVVAGFLLGQVEAWRRGWQEGRAEERKAALTVRQAALMLIEEMSAAERDAQAMLAGTMNTIPLPGDLWSKYGPTLAQYPAYTNDWMRVIAAYQVFDQANKGQAVMNEAAGAAARGQEAAWDIVAKIEHLYGTGAEDDHAESPFRRWLRAMRGA